MKIDEHFSNAAISSVHSPPKPNEEKGFNADDYKEDFGVSEFSKEEIEILTSYGPFKQQTVEEQE